MRLLYAALFVAGLYLTIASRLASHSCAFGALRSFF